MRSWQRNAAGYLSFVPYRRKAVRYPKGIMSYFNSATLEAPDFSRGRVHYPPDIEVGCRRCHYSFSVREHENGDDGFEIDDVIDDVIDERRKPCF